MTALHQASGAGHLEVIRLLIQHGAPLEKRNAYGGTVLDSTLWFADHADAASFARGEYAAVIDTLIAAGARTDHYPEMQEHINEVYRRAGRSPRGP